LEFWRLEGQRETQSGRTPISSLYMKIRADSGLEGLYGPIDDEAAAVVDQWLRPVVSGKDPLAMETLWEAMYRSNRHARTGLFMMAISAVDNTLWDLKGRYFGVPVFRLLGGPTRPDIEAYASCLGYSLESSALQKQARLVKDQGFRYQKWFFATGPEAGPEGFVKNVEVVKTLREALGDDADIMFDASRHWDLNYAIAWAKQVEKHRPRWIEEAFDPDHIDSFAQLRRATSVPVASGEHIYGRWEAHDYLRAGALNVLQTDPEWCGGITELLRICAIASAYDVTVIPHGHSLHAAIHVIASQSPVTCPLAEYLVQKMATYYHFEKYPPRLTGARFPLPDRPGFGVELDPAKVQKQTPVHWS
jgi:L-alanine-DL-glutamate epimerase-like enolase superfamily enzyme